MQSFFKHSIQKQILMLIVPSGIIGILIVSVITYFALQEEGKEAVFEEAESIVEGIELLAQATDNIENLYVFLNGYAEDPDINDIIIVTGLPPKIIYSSNGELDGTYLNNMDDSEYKDFVFNALAWEKTSESSDIDNTLLAYAKTIELPVTDSPEPETGLIIIRIDSESILPHIIQHLVLFGSVNLALIFVVCGIVYFLLQRRILRPLENIFSTIKERFSGNNNAYVDVITKDELGLLAEALNTLFDAQYDSEKELRYTSELIQTVIDNVPGTIFWKDKKLRYLGCNKHFADKTGIGSIRSIIGKRDDELGWLDEEANLYMQHDEEVLRSNKEVIGNTEFIFKRDGTLNWIEINKIPLRDNKGSVIGVLGSYVDITDRKRNEEEREATSKYNSLLVNISNQLNMSHDKDFMDGMKGILKEISDVMVVDRVSLWSIGDDKEMSVCSMLYEAGKDDFSEGISFALQDYKTYFETLKSGKSIIASDAFSHPYTSMFIESYLSPYRIQSLFNAPVMVAGNIWGTICIEQTDQKRHWSVQEEQFMRSLTDVLSVSIASRKNVEITGKISEQNQFFDLVLNATQDGVWDWNLLDNTVFFSSKWTEMLGYEDDEIKGVFGTFKELIHPEDYGYTQKAIDNYLNQQSGFYEVIFRMRTKGGDYKWILSRGKAIFDSNKKPVRFVGTHTDIDDMRHAQEEITRQKNLLDKMIENLPLGLFAKDAKNEFRYIIWNKQMERIFGVSREKMYGINDFEQFGENEAEYRRMTDMQIFDSDNAVEIYEEIQTDDNRDINAYIKKFPLFDQNHKPEMVVGIVDDITNTMNVQRELEEYRNHLEALVEEQTRDLILAKEEAEIANQAKSDFLANMSHELRTPMHAIINYSRIGYDKIGEVPEEKIKKFLDNIYKSGNRLLHLVNDLLDLSKMEAGQMDFHFDFHDINVSVNHIREELKSLLDEKDITIDVINDTESYEAYYDDNRIIQVLINLFSNAIKFTDAGKVISVTYKDELLDSAAGVVPGLSISIADQGVGIPEEELERVFDKFAQSSRTKTGAGGTGLGLAISKEILDAHQGRIWAENNPEGGAKFTLVIPRNKFA